MTKNKWPWPRSGIQEEEGRKPVQHMECTAHSCARVFHGMHVCLVSSTGAVMCSTDGGLRVCVVAQCVFMLSMAAIVFLRLECCLGLDNLHAAPFPLLCPSVPALSPGLCRSFPPLESQAEGRRWGGGSKLRRVCCHATCHAFGFQSLGNVS